MRTPPRVESKGKKASTRGKKKRKGERRRRQENRGERTGRKKRGGEQEARAERRAQESREKERAQEERESQAREVKAQGEREKQERERQRLWRSEENMREWFRLGEEARRRRGARPSTKRGEQPPAALEMRDAERTEEVQTSATSGTQRFSREDLLSARDSSAVMVVATAGAATENAMRCTACSRRPSTLVTASASVFRWRLIPFGAGTFRAMLARWQWCSTWVC